MTKRADEWRKLEATLRCPVCDQDHNITWLFGDVKWQLYKCGAIIYGDPAGRAFLFKSQKDWDDQMRKR